MEVSGSFIEHLTHTRVINAIIGPLHDPITWHETNYTGKQITQWDFQNKGKSDWTGTSSFVLEVPLRDLRPTVRNLFRTMWLDRAKGLLYDLYTSVFVSLYVVIHLWISLENVWRN